MCGKKSVGREGRFQEVMEKGCDKNISFFFVPLLFVYHLSMDIGTYCSCCQKYDKEEKVCQDCAASICERCYQRNWIYYRCKQCQNVQWINIWVMELFSRCFCFGSLRY